MAKDKKNAAKKKAKKGWFSTFIMVVLLIAGLGLMLYPKISDAWQRYLLQQEVAEYNKQLSSLVEDNERYTDFWLKAQEYNQFIKTKDTPLIATQDEIDYLQRELNPAGNRMVGSLKIPAIDVEVPIYQGTNEDSLQAGGGWWIGTSYPVGGEGNHSVVTAHTGLVKAELFTNLDKLEEGDIFSFKILDRDLYYQVDQILVTTPDDTAPLMPVEGEDYMTLYTCTPYGVNTHRLLVRGKRIHDPVIPAQTILKGKLMNWWWILLLLLPLLLIPLFKRKKKVPPASEEEKEPVVPMPGLTRKIPLELQKQTGQKRKTLKQNSLVNTRTEEPSKPNPSDDLKDSASLLSQKEQIQKASRMKHTRKQNSGRRT